MIIESMCAKKIILSSNCSNGPREIIKDGINGFKFEINNKAEFLDKFQKIIDLNLNDKSMINKILSNGMKTSKLYTLYNHFNEINHHII